ncbi:MAG: hypothetical protein ACO3B6_00635 [Ilumatobacteraceae bacterium]
MFLSATDRRRVTLVGLLTLVVVPAVVFFTRGEPQAEVATVAAAGLSIDASPGTSEALAPVFLSGPAGVAPTGTAPIAYPSGDSAKLTGQATFSSFNGAPNTV